VTPGLIAGQLQVLAQAHSLNPSPVAFGADGAPLTAPLESVRSTPSVVFRFRRAVGGRAGERGIGEARQRRNPALVPISSGVSSIHSAVAWVDGYGTVVL
jgi:hypothetical protein